MEPAIAEGVRVHQYGTLIMVDGEILGNTCNDSGGGVWHEGHLKCQAAQSQETLLVRVGVYYYSGRFNQLGGKISGNTADIDKDVCKK